MRKLLYFLASSLCVQAGIIPILSETASSSAGIFGTGAYNDGVRVEYALEQYDREDVPQAGLSQRLYFHYSYLFNAAAVPASLTSGNSGFNHLIVALPWDCGGDPECIFGIRSEGATATPGEIKLHDEGPGLTNPIHGLLFAISPAAPTVRLSFFSNRIPDGNGRVYARGGDDYLVSDAGVVITPNSHVLPQDGAHSPEPRTLALFGSGIGFVLALRGLQRK